MDAKTLFATYEDRLRRRRVTEGSIQEYRQTTGRFARWLEEHDLKLENIKRPDIEDFFAETGWAASTQRARLTWIRRTWAYAVDQELLERTPFNGMPVELPKVPQREPRIIPIADLRAIKAHIADHRANALFHVLAYTGFRREEISLLRWDDVSFGAQTIHTIGKGNKERTIPLHPALQEALRSYGVFGQGSMWVFPGRNGGQMTLSGMNGVVKRLSAPFKYTAHDYRRTFATSLAENGATRQATKQLLGHEENDVTARYVGKVSQRVLFEEILKVYRHDPL